MSDLALDEILVFHYLKLTWSNLIYMCVCSFVDSRRLIGFRRYIVSAWATVFLYIKSSNSFYSKCWVKTVSDQHYLMLSISTTNSAFPDMYMCDSVRTGPYTIEVCIHILMLTRLQYVVLSEILIHILMVTTFMYVQCKHRHR